MSIQTAMEKFRKFSLDETGRRNLTTDPACPSEPIFQIGGKTDPNRFQSRHSQPYVGFGLHDDERSDRLDPRHLEFFNAQRRLLVERMIGSVEPPTAKALPIPGGNVRPTMSPVHEIAPSSPTDPTTPKAIIKIEVSLVRKIRRIHFGDGKLTATSLTKLLDFAYEKLENCHSRSFESELLVG